MQNTGAWNYMQQQVLTDETKIGEELFSPQTITPAQQTALWNDPDYGLKDANNFVRWDPLIYGRDSVSS